MVYMYNRLLWSPKKERNIFIYNNVDGLQGHCAKWIKWSREGQMPYDLTYMWSLKERAGRSQEQIGVFQIGSVRG